jgi:hypothetical protein
MDLFEYGSDFVNTAVVPGGDLPNGKAQKEVVRCNWFLLRLEFFPVLSIYLKGLSG